ncbi:35291_t:CDS:2, partial [Racocetra persica]
LEQMILNYTTITAALTVQAASTDPCKSRVPCRRVNSQRNPGITCFRCGEHSYYAMDCNINFTEAEYDSGIEEEEIYTARHQSY